MILKQWLMLLRLFFPEPIYLGICPRINYHYAQFNTLGSIAIITYCNLNKILFGLFIYYFLYQ